MNNPLNAFTVYASLALKTDEFFQQLNSAFRNITGTVAKLGTAAVSAASAGIVAFGKSAIETGQNFDKSMSQVAATMGKTTEEIADLRDFAQEMGRTTAFSANDSAKALNYMALAGYDAETSMKMLPNVLNLAAAGGMDLASASDMITDSQSALGLSLDETTQLVDKMAKASSKSNTSVEQLGDAILTVGGTAKKLKGGTTELATVLGILADNGIKGSEGGTALRNIMNSLISPTDDAAAMLESMGTSLYDAEGNMRSLNDVFIDLRNGMSGLATQAEKDQVLTTIFNARDLKSAEALIANVGDRFSELSTEIENSADAADAMAQTQLDNLAGDMTLFQSALEGAKIAVSDQLTPAIRDFVQLGTDGLSAVTEAFSAGVKEGGLEKGFDNAVNALQPIIDQLIEKVVDILPKVVSIAVKLVSALGQAIVKNIPKLADSAVQLLKGFAEDITKNAPTAIKGFSDMLKKVSEWIKKNGRTLISSGMEMINSIAKGISGNLPSMINSVTEIITFIASEISKNTNGLFDSALDIIAALGKGIFENLPELVGAALDIVTSLGGYIIEKIPVLVDKAPEIVESLAKALGDCGEKIVTAAYNLMTKFAEAIGLSDEWEEIKNSVKGAFDNISNSFSDMKEALQPLTDTFANLKDSIFGTETKSGLLKKSINLLCDVISKTIGIVGKVISGLMNFVTWLNNGTTGAYVLKSAIESVATAISLTLIGGAIKSLIAKLPVLLASITAQTTALITNAAAWIAAAAPILGIVAAISSVILIGKLLIDNWDEIKKFCIGVWNEMQDRLMEFWESLDSGWHTIWDSITGFFSERIDDLKTGWKSIIDFFKEKKEDWKTVIDSIKDFLQKLADKFQSVVNIIKNHILNFKSNWENGVKDIKNWVDDLKKKIEEIPEKFVDLVNGALNWGKDLIENFMQGAKEKIDEWNSFWEEVGFTIYDILHHSTPEKGPLKDDDKWGGDLMDNLINGIKSKEKSLSDTIKNIAQSISETFEKPVSLNADITTDENFSNLKIPDISGENFMDNFISGIKSKEKTLLETFKSITQSIRKTFEQPISVDTDITATGHFNRLKVPDISTVAENIYTVKSDNAKSYQTEKESPVTVENLNIYVEGTNFNSEYEIERLTDMLANRLNARSIRKSRGTGGAFY